MAQPIRIGLKIINAVHCKIANWLSNSIIEHAITVFSFKTQALQALESSMRARKGFKMRRFLNLNQPSMVFMKIIGCFMVLIPAVLYGAVLLSSRTGMTKTLLLRMIKISFGVGIFVFVVFLVLIVIELIQDHHFDAQYQKQRNQKVVLANGFYECQYCGNQKVQEHDTSCGVCGKEFEWRRSK